MAKIFNVTSSDDDPCIMGTKLYRGKMKNTGADFLWQVSTRDGCARLYIDGTECMEFYGVRTATTTERGREVLFLFVKNTYLIAQLEIPIE